MKGCAALNRKLSGVVWPGAIAITAMASAIAAAQVPAAAPSLPEPATKAPAFEVASIKLSKSGDSGENSDSRNGRFTATNVSVKTLIEYDAYGIPRAQIAGGPDWLSSEKFDIAAKADDATAERMKTLSNAEETHLLRQMVQQLLADRFKLAVHWESKELPVYALVVAKGGPKLAATKDTSGGTSTSGSNGKLNAKGVTMKKLAQTLTQILGRELGRDVIDKTGVEGRYDLVLTWSPQDNSAAMTTPSSDTSAAAGPSIFTALQEQLGLKLESTKGQVETLVIDHVEQPSAN
jgi:uncharacterized protein (TIGR03435 family)